MTLFSLPKQINEWMYPLLGLSPSFTSCYVPAFAGSGDCATIAALASHDGVDIGTTLYRLEAPGPGSDDDKEGSTIETETEDLGGLPIGDILSRCASISKSEHGPDVVKMPHLLGQSFPLYDVLCSTEDTSSRPARLAESRIPDVYWLSPSAIASCETTELFLDPSRRDMEHARWCVSEQDSRSLIFALELMR